MAKSDDWDLNFLASELLDRGGNPRYIERYLRLLSRIDHSNLTIVEYHHILPRCLFPQYADDSWNLVPLSPRAHYLIHVILSEMFPGNYGLGTAVAWNSSRFKSSGIVNKIIERNRAQQSEIASKHAKRRLAEGTHNFGQHPWNHIDSNESTRIIWGSADKLYRSWVELFSPGQISLGALYNVDNCGPIQRIIYKFKDGWNPEMDADWIKYRDSRSSFLEESLVFDKASLIPGPWNNRRIPIESRHAWIKFPDVIASLHAHEFNIRKVESEFSSSPGATIWTMCQKYQSGEMTPTDHKYLKWRELYEARLDCTE